MQYNNAQSNLAPNSTTRVIYRDLKPDNIGFDIRDDVKIFDFGLAKELNEKLRYRDSDTYKLTGETGSPRYMAPEIANRRPYNQKADVYSFALLFWQICELKVPYDDYDMHLLTCNGEFRVLRLSFGLTDEFRIQSN